MDIYRVSASHAALRSACQAHQQVLKEFVTADPVPPTTRNVSLGSSGIRQTIPRVWTAIEESTEAK